MHLRQGKLACFAGDAFVLIRTPGCPSQKQVEVHTEGWHDPHQWQGLPFCKVYRVSLFFLICNAPLTFCPVNLSGDRILLFLLPLHVSSLCWLIDFPVLSPRSLCILIYVELLLLIIFTSRAKAIHFYQRSLSFPPLVSSNSCSMNVARGFRVFACENVNIQRICPSHGMAGILNYK